MSGRYFVMDTTKYWPFACKFSIQNASAAVLQFWTEDLDPQHCHQESVHSFLVQWLCPATVTCWRGSIIWSLHDHIEQALQKSTSIRRYWIQKWEWKYECSHYFYVTQHNHFTSPHRKISLLDLPPQVHTHLPATPMQYTTDWLMKKTIQPHIH